MKDLSMGDLLMVTCTDPGAINDIPAWCRINGHKVIHTATVDKEITITIEASQNK
jgi:tRNA 2-thiouridine synthesizing protein A